MYFHVSHDFNLTHIFSHHSTFTCFLGAFSALIFTPIVSYTWNVRVMFHIHLSSLAVDQFGVGFGLELKLGRVSFYVTHTFILLGLVLTLNKETSVVGLEPIWDSDC